MFFRVSFHNILYSASSNWITIITCILLVLITYFELASYSVYGSFRETMKKLFNAAIMNAHLLILTYAIITALFAVVYLISIAVFNLSAIAGLVAGAVLTTLAITFSRIYLINVVNRI